MRILWLRFRYRFCPKKRRRRRPLRRGFFKRISRCCLTVGVLLVLGLSFRRMEQRIGPLAQEAALAALDGAVVQEIYASIDELLQKEGLSADALIRKNTDENGRIQSMSLDAMTINRLQVALTSRLDEILDGQQIIEAEIPFGALISDTLLTGAGFPVPVKVFATQTADICFCDTFSSAGINQTRYQLMLEIKAPIRVVGIFSHRDGEVFAQVPIAETVVLGDVPNTYFVGGVE